MRADNILHLGVKELWGLARDPMMLVLIVYAFTLSIYTAATAAPETLHKAPIAIVDEDQSPLSQRIVNAFYPPYFLPPKMVTHAEMDSRMDAGLDTFALNIPPEFQRDVLAGRSPAIQLNVDATRVGQAFTGSGYVQTIVTEEVQAFARRYRADPTPPVDLAGRVRFNPELNKSWFAAVIQVINQVTMLSIVLTGAALIRERERGTIEHLLVMPVTPLEIMTSKVWAMGLVVLAACAFSLVVVVRGLLSVPIEGSLLLFLAGAVLHLFATTSMGIFMGTFARSMPQFGLLLILVLLPLQMLSGGSTPRESMPGWVQNVMLAAPTTHFVMLAQGILYRGAGLSIVWPQFLALALIGAVFFGIALARFRRTIGTMASASGTTPGWRDEAVDNAAFSEEDLNALQWTTLLYYIREFNYENGLIADKTQPGSPASIAAVGMAVATAPVFLEGYRLPRELLAKNELRRLRFFWNSPQGPEPDATGYQGFYCHFLDMETGRRAGQCELSTVDSAFLLAGMLAAASYFDGPSEEEHEIRSLVDALYRRVDWQWALNGGATLTHGWKPETGFLPYRWHGYDEALLLYVLGMGSPTYPLPEESYAAWASTYEWKEVYGYEYLYSGPLFTHQLSHLWIDFRGIQDAFMRERGIDYFENSRRATLVHQQYAIRNPLQFEGYNELCWGITASDGPGWTVRTVNGRERRFFDYVARGAPHGPDDGTIAPWAVVASLPFAPEIVLPTIKNLGRMDLGMLKPSGFKATFNQTFPVEGSDHGWVSPWHFGIDQGPIILMIENYRTGLLWRLMRRCPYIVTGLRRAGFQNGWL